MFASKFSRGRGGFAAGGGGARFVSGGGGGSVKGRRYTNMASSFSSAGGSRRLRRKVYPAGARRRGFIPRALVAQGVETKYLDMTGTKTLTAPTDWTGCEANPTTLLCLNTMIQGTSASQREGRKITCVSIEVEGIISQAAQVDQAAADVAPIVGVYLVLDTQTNGGTATGLDSENVFINPSGNAAVGCSPLRNMLYSKRYKIVGKWVKQLPQLPISYDGANMEQAGQATPFKLFKKLGFVSEFLGNAGTVADISTNGLFVIAACSNTSTAPSLLYNARLRFRG